MTAPEAEGLAEVISDIRRLWDVTPAGEEDAAADAYEILDRATTLRRASDRGPSGGDSSGRGPAWAIARLAEGLSRMYVARQMAEWGNRSYAIQALEAAIDGLRDAAASLPDGFSPSRSQVAAFREALLIEWRTAQSDPDLSRIAALSLPALRGKPC